MENEKKNWRRGTQYNDTQHNYSNTTFSITTLRLATKKRHSGYRQLQSDVGNGGIHIGINYSVLNEMKRYN